MKTLVLYYSQKGSNRYLAERIARDLSCDLEAIRPRMDAPLLMMAGLHLGNRKLQHDPAQYDRVILCGPIWVGQFIAPLRSFVKRHLAGIRQLVFVTCCGSTDAKKNEKFGYGLVFRQVQAMLQEKCTQCQAFPIGLVLPPDKHEDSQLMMKTHLNDDNFKGEMAERYAAFMQALGR
jgi:menaquinone-dependent protoporphyrinogen IX oxidase